MEKLEISDVQGKKKLKEPSLAFLTNVRIIQNGIAGHFAPKAVVAVFIKGIEFANMAILEIWVVLLDKI